MNVSAGSCVICLEDDDDEDIIELCEHGTYTTQQGTQKHHGVCINCFPQYVRNNPWNCATCRRSYGPKFEHHRAIAFGEAAEGSLPQAEPAWMSAPLVSVADLHERTAPQLDPVFEHPGSEPEGGFMDQNEAFNFGRLRAAMVRRREPSVEMASSPPPPPPPPPPPEPAALDYAFNFVRLRAAMGRRPSSPPVQIPDGTKVLLYRPLGEDDVTVGEVAMHDPESGTYGVTDNNGTTEIMRPGLDFVVPRRGVRVLDTTENDAAATILDVVYGGLFLPSVLMVPPSESEDICLNVKYDNEELEDSPLYDVEDNHLEKFRYEGLPRMNVGQLVKVYPGRYWDVNVQAPDAGVIGTITQDLVNTQGSYYVQMREGLQRVYKVQRDEAMPYNEDAMGRRREQSVEMASSPPPPPPPPEPAALDEAFNFGRLRNAMRRRGNFDGL